MVPIWSYKVATSVSVYVLGKPITLCIPVYMVLAGRVCDRLAYMVDTKSYVIFGLRPGGAATGPSQPVQPAYIIYLR